ncbi:thioesterase family protein [Celeribacter indicus]|uniref:Thioesterase n=1 Tax=Celeribacter indicus TaxID=1208324 RepID=A0A0B5E6Z0_9RHOB|nr:thioesterase family protein [Celeribacter indicus]AJE49210.1 hypothetical protein P73_4495 [Celeribacter indicus]
MEQDGVLTHVTKVNQWECDHNGHWNVRFYSRAAQAASEAAAVLCGASNPGAASVTTRHLRYHRELFSGAPVRVRSGVLTGGPQAGALLHLIESHGRLSATALDRTPGPVPQVGAFPAGAATHALPRGLPPGDFVPLREGEAARDVILGPVPTEARDHTGDLSSDGMMNFVSIASHGLLNALGFTPEFVARTGISRMAVEMKTTRHVFCPESTILSARSVIAAVTGKSAVIRHDLYSATTGTVIASAAQCIVMVDLSTRKAVPMPEELARGFGTAMPAAVQ